MYIWDKNVLLHEIKKEGKQEDEITTWVFQGFTPVAKIQGDKSYSIISDHLGTPLQAIDTQGNKVWERELDIYGKVRKETEETANFVPMLYQGQYLDNETELAYNRFRYYDCNTGTYISQDPISIAGGLNVYAYVHDPNSWVDVLGLRGLWKLTTEGTSKKRTIGQHTYYQHKSTGLWWSIDTAKHGGSAFKVFKEGKGGY
ncbi:RHS repeat domain-containing protein [Treponema pedis]|uniref:RHS repeat domain-containing protein n=1 Tax=Treponema pedis TaxID=409322 RepID=UPI00197D5169|nr:RHS repeat-associated core domain-containing protein [Treponema pedis]